MRQGLYVSKTLHTVLPKKKVEKWRHKQINWQGSKINKKKTINN